MNRLFSCVYAVAAVAALGLVAAGCGSTAPVTHRAHPIPTESAQSNTYVGPLTWTAPQTIDPGGAEFTSISCPSSTFCVALDTNGDALTWDGTEWSNPQFIDDVSNIDDYVPVFDVSCASSSFCAAVDGNGDALTWNGSAWSTPQSIVSSALTCLSGSGSCGALNSVSCISSTFCMASGFVMNVSSSSSYGVTLTWDGSNWSAPQHLGNGGQVVSCAPASFCAAVSDTAYTWTGRTWSRAARVAGEFQSVSCVSATFCVALDANEVNESAVTWNGSTWSAPRTITSDGSSNSVSCKSTSFCVAVDLYGMAYAWNGSTWSVRSSVPSGASPHAYVSCVSSALCVEVEGESAVIGRSRRQKQ